jgi:hypothetical protein
VSLSNHALFTVSLVLLAHRVVSVCRCLPRSNLVRDAFLDHSLSLVVRSSALNLKHRKARPLFPDETNLDWGQPAGTMRREPTTPF